MSLPPRPDVLAGREDLLAELDARLAGGEGPRVAALHGMGGAGKTSLAVEYAHRHLAEVAIAWQFPAEDPLTLRAEFARLAAILGARDVADARDPVATVHAVLAGSAAPWLLIFDNAPDPASVREFTPPTGDGRVLVTSQHGTWPAGQGLHVPPLDTDVAAGFVMNRTGARDQAGADELAVELGGLPLAMEQAAAYMLEAGMSIARYLELFRDRRAELLRRGRVPGHEAGTAATIGLALTRLETGSPSAAGLLRLLACLAPEPVPLRLLLDAAGPAAGNLDEEVAAVLGPLAGDELAAGDAAAALRRYSLITPAGDGMVLVHRLVQAAVTDQMGEAAGRWRQAAAAAVEAAMPQDPQDPGNWPVFAALLPHARQVLGPGSAGRALAASYLGRSGGYAMARDLHQQILAARTAGLGPEHPDTLGERDEVAFWTGLAGDPAAARDLAAAVLRDQARVLGPDHPDTLDTRNNLASWTGEAGDPAKARDLAAAVLRDRERVLGPRHPDTLDTRNRLASWTGMTGDPAAARDLAAAVLRDQERVLGPDHPDTLDTRNNLASWTREAERRGR